MHRFVESNNHLWKSRFLKFWQTIEVHAKYHLFRCGFSVLVVLVPISILEFPLQIFVLPKIKKISITIKKEGNNFLISFPNFSWFVFSEFSPTFSFSLSFLIFIFYIFLNFFPRFSYDFLWFFSASIASRLYISILFLSFCSNDHRQNPDKMSRK